MIISLSPKNEKKRFHARLFAFPHPFLLSVSFLIFVLIFSIDFGFTRNLRFPLYLIETIYMVFDLTICATHVLVLITFKVCDNSVWSKTKTVFLEFCPTTSFRFHLTMDTLVIGYVFPTTTADQEPSSNRNVRHKAYR